MIRRPPISTRTDTLFPYTTLFRSRQSGDQDGRFCPTLNTPANTIEPREAGGNRFDQRCFFEGLLDKLDGACLHGTDRDGNVAMSGQDNDGHRHAALIKNLLHLESVHLGHTNVEKDASRLDMTNLAQEGDARWIGDRTSTRLNSSH